MPTTIAIEAAKHGIKSEMTFFYSIVGIGFHPDTDFADYIDLKTNRKAFGRRAVKMFNSRLDECFEMAKKYDLDIYALAAEVMPEIE